MDEELFRKSIENLNKSNRLGTHNTKEQNINISKALHKRKIKPRFRKDSNRWRVSFIRFGENIHLGHFSTEQKAQEAINLWEKNNNYNGTK